MARFVHLMITLTLCGAASPLLDKSSLQQINIIVRHGARSPTNPFPNDRYRDYWPQGYGQLTEVGIQQMFELGKYIGQYYAGFLNHTYINDELTVRSSNWDRTLMSAQSVLSGLYMPADDQLWQTGIAWQPVPVHTVRQKQDILLDTDNPVCPPYDQMKADTYASDSFQRQNASYASYYQRIKNLTGKTDDMDPFGVWDVYDAIYAEINEKLPIPSWFTEEDKKLMTEVFVPWQFDINFGGLQKGRLKGGPLITEMVENMHFSINGTMEPERRKAFFYIGHDNNVVTTMKITETYNERYVPVASLLVLELHKVDDEYFVQMLFRNSSAQETPFVLNITVCGGKSSCPFDEFVAAVSPFFITTEDWFRECQGPKSALSAGGIIGVTLGVVAIFILVAGAVLYLAKVGVTSKVHVQTDSTTSTRERTPLLSH